jgi:hypothetical protein
LQAEFSAPVLQLTGPRAWGAQPVKSATRVPSRRVALTRIWIGCSLIPSPSMKSSAS